MAVSDAPLTPPGKKQAATLAQFVPNHIQEQIDLFAADLHHLPPEAEECNDYPRDTGSSRSLLEANSEFTGPNFDRLTADWTSKTEKWAADTEALRARARSVRHFLLSRPEKYIVLVAHGDVLRRITATAEVP